MSIITPGRVIWLGVWISLAVLYGSLAARGAVEARRLCSDVCSVEVLP
jgi:hypothetical protein